MPDAPLPASIEARAAATDQRIIRLEHAGRIIWIKKREPPSMRMRIQKGDPESSFRSELEALKLLHTKGIPVPDILAEGPDYFAIADSGLSLKQLLQDQTRSSRSQAIRPAANLPGCTKGTFHTDARRSRIFAGKTDVSPFWISSVTTKNATRPKGICRIW